MYYPSLDYDLDIIRAVREASARVPDVAAEHFERVVKPALDSAVQAYIAPYPGPVKYPFQFASVKSRKAYFATRGFGKGIPSHRTGVLGASWVVRVDRRRVDGFITLRNLAPYAEFVVGDVHQTPGHAETGWGGAELDAGIAEFTEIATNAIVDAWATIVDTAIGMGQ